MEVVVVGEAAQGGLGLRKAFEQVPVENLALKDLPEGLDLAVGPGRRDLCAKVPDIQIAQSLPEAGEHARHPDHKGVAVVAHELQRLPAKLETVLEPPNDGRGLRVGVDLQPDEEAGVIVNQAEEPSLEVTAAGETDEERTHEVDVPEFVGLAPFVPWPWRRRNAAPAATEALEEFIDVGVANLVDLPAFHLGGNSLRVPVRCESDGDDDPAHPVRNSRLSLKAGARLGKQGGDATGFVESSP